MANTVEVAKAYVPMLDKIYKAASRTSVLDVAPALVKAGNKAGSFLLPHITLTGLGNYSKASGYAVGDVSFEWEEYSYNFDRGRRMTVDAVDDIETAGQMFGALADEFIRTQVAPEVDALRIAKLATGAGQLMGAVIDDSAEVIAALNAAKALLEEAEVTVENMVLFIPPSILALAQNAPDSAVKCPLLAEAVVVKVPQSRMVSAVTLDAGASASAGGWAKAGGADDINFILMDKGAAFVDAKHDQPRIFDPMTFQDSNSWAFDYRLYHDLFIYTEKADGIVAHYANALIS